MPKIEKAWKGIFKPNCRTL